VSDTPSEQPVEEPRPDQTPQPEPTTPETPGEPTPQPEPPRQVSDWRDRRIGEQQARIRELRAELERYRGNGQAQPQGQMQGQQAPQGYAAPPPDQAFIERQIEERAAALAATQEFNRRCNETAEAGRRAFPDFDTKVQKLVGLVDGNDPASVSVYNSFLNAAMETGEASKLIYSLGGDLNEASRILSLPPVRMAVELTRMSSRPVQEISGAPRPINPAASMGVNNRTPLSADDPNSDQLTTEEWMRRREEQISSRRTAR
jgi:hypothetical protein